MRRLIKKVLFWIVVVFVFIFASLCYLMFWAAEKLEREEN